MLLCPPNFLTKETKTYNGEKTASSTNVAEKKNSISLQKTETRSRFVNLCKYQLKVIKELNIRPATLKLVQDQGIHWKQ
jgi:hypothetical protein